MSCSSIESRWREAQVVGLYGGGYIDSRVDDDKGNQTSLNAFERVPEQSGVDP